MVITCFYTGLGLLAIFWAWRDSKHPRVMDERHA